MGEASTASWRLRRSWSSALSSRLRETNDEVGCVHGFFGAKHGALAMYGLQRQAYARQHGDAKTCLAEVWKEYLWRIIALCSSDVKCASRVSITSKTALDPNSWYSAT